MVEGISREAVIVQRLRQRKLLFPNARILREDILRRAELIGEKLRDPQVFADFTVNSILSLLFSRLSE